MSTEIKSHKLFIDAKWHSKVVAERRQWLKHNQDQIDWYKKQVVSHEEYKEQLEQWLTEAIANQERFLKGESNAH